MSGSPFASHWSLDPGVTFLNHGSFGACPTPVLEAQRALRDQMERQPVRFFVRELPDLLASARASLGTFLGAPADDLAFVSNATMGVNAVLRSLTFSPGDELLTTDHEYRACHLALEYVAERAGATVVVARVPYPVAHEDEALEAVLSCVTPRTRLALIDHVTSQTAMVLPIRAIVSALAERGIDALVDGAHAPGMVPLDLASLGAAYYTGNCHKWLCAPKGAAFLYVRPDRQDRVRPVCISHGACVPPVDGARFRAEFDWTGTDDPTAWLAVPAALGFLGALLPGGWPELMARNHQGALAGRATLLEALGASAPCPDAMVGSTATVPLPDRGPELSPSPFALDPLQDQLWERYGLEVPVIPWPSPPRRLLRISCQVYNAHGQYVLLARALRELLPR